jgi:hypothetical protein
MNQKDWDKVATVASVIAGFITLGVAIYEAVKAFKD